MMGSQFSTIEGTDENGSVHFIDCAPNPIANILYRVVCKSKKYEHFSKLTLRPATYKRCGTGWV